jgi:K+-sensing histidine kinase KdpD
MFPDYLQNGGKKPVKKEFKVLQEISNSIILVNNPAEIANLILDIVARHINAVNCSLTLVNENDEQCILAARGGVNNFIRYRVGNIGKGIAEWTEKKRVPFFVSNIDKNRRLKKLKRTRYHNNSFISCPIKRKNRLFGVLNVSGKKDKTDFTAEEFALIKMICNQAAIAFENYFLVNRLKMKADEMEEINHKLIQMDMVKTEFLTRLSHELRNPLNSIKGSIYYLNLSDNMNVCEQKDFFKIILKETDRLISFIENLLSFFETGDESGASKDGFVDLAEILNEINESGFLSNLSGKKPFKLVIDIKGRIPSVLGNRQGIVKMFYHLIEGFSRFLRENDNQILMRSSAEWKKC